MIKVEVVEDFTLGRYNELKNIIRKGKEENGRLFKGDVFECEEELCNYLSGNNPYSKSVVKIIEVEPKKETAKKELEKAVEDIGEKINENIEVVEVEEKPIKPKKKKKK